MHLLATTTSVTSFDPLIPVSYDDDDDGDDDDDDDAVAGALAHHYQRHPL